MLLAGLAFLALNHWIHRFNGYTVRNDQVFFHQINMQYQAIATPILMADAASFYRYPFPWHEYGRDHSFVFYRGHLLPDCDPNTFEITNLRQALSRDVERTYRKATKLSETATSYRHLGGGYHLDKNRAYWGNPIRNADIKSFEFLGFSYQFGSKRGAAAYAKDKFQVYCDGQVIEGAIPATFELLGSNYATDGEQVYYRYERMPGTDVASFVVSTEFSDRDLAHDQHRSYANGRALP